MINHTTSAPINVTLKITNTCNLNCLHCHSKSGYIPMHMPKQQLKNIVDQLRQSKVFGINISGGEPLLYPDFFEIVKYIDSTGIRVTISTNAVLVNDVIAQKMLEANIKGCHVSLDASTGEIHDRIRNVPGCFERACRGIKTLVKNGIPVMAVTVISSQSPEEYSRTIDLAYQLGAGAHKTNALMPIGNATEHLNLLKDKFLQEHIEVWKRKKEEYKGKMDLKAEMGFLMQIGLENYYQQNIPDIFNVGCPAGITTCAILEDSKVALCSFCPDVVCGDLKKESFKEIWENSPIFQKIRKRDFETCRLCPHNEHCGGCRIRALYNGDLYGTDPYCWRRCEHE